MTDAHTAAHERAALQAHARAHDHAHTHTHTHAHTHCHCHAHDCLAADCTDDLRARHSSKWRRYPADVLPMHVAEMDFQVAEPIKEVLHDFVARGDLGYLGPIPEVGEAFAGFAQRHWGWQLDPTQIKLATDVGVACVEFMRANSKPGDKVVISSPVYASFFNWIRELGLEIVDAPLRRDLGAPEHERWTLDLDALADAFAGASFYLMCHPQNPVGRIHTREELAAIAELAERHGVVVLSDEIHAPLTYAGGEFTPYLAVSDAARRTGVCITSSSKTFNTAGLKAAILLWSSPEIAKLVANIPADAHWRSSILGGFSMVCAFTDCDVWLGSCLTALEQNRELVLQLVEERLPGVVTHRPQNSYLNFFEVSALGLGDDPADTILREARIALVPGPDMGGAAYRNYVRFNFGTSPEHIERAIDAIAAIRR